eukprot:4675312-Prymnesium_polylepis.1
MSRRSSVRNVRYALRESRETCAKHVRVVRNIASHRKSTNNQRISRNIRETSRNITKRRKTCTKRA